MYRFVLIAAAGASLLASRVAPKDTNETMEGRARTRRVELVKAG